MKKMLLSITALAVTGIMNAQSEFKTFKPHKDNVTTELGLTGGLLDSDISLSEGTLLRGRYFIKDKNALRVGLNVTSESEKENFYRSMTSSDKGVYTEAGTAFILNLGYEKHFNGTNRLSPYIGGDIILGYASEKTSGDKTDGYEYDSDYNFEEKTSSFSWGIRGVFGADYYFTKNVYLGVEAGLGFINTKQGSATGWYEVGGVTEEIKIKSPGSDFSFSPSISTGIRIGFVF